jgi:hypothetical protein
VSFLPRQHPQIHGVVDFHHRSAVRAVTDNQPSVRDNDDRIGATGGVPISRDGSRIRHVPLW